MTVATSQYLMSADQLDQAKASSAWCTAAYLLTVLLIIHAGFRGVYADLDSAIYTTWYRELATIEPANFITRLFSSGWIFSAREDSLVRFEWGFTLLGWILSIGHMPIELFYLLIACLSLLPKAYMAGKYSNYPVTSMIWYSSFCYLLLEMNAIRAGIAAAIMVLSLESLSRRRYRRYFTLIVVASTFHISALIALFFPFYFRWRPSKFSLYAGLGCAFVLSFLNITFFFGLLEGVSVKIAEYKTAFDQGVGDVAYLRLNIFNLSTIGFLFIGVLWIFMLPPSTSSLLAGRKVKEAAVYLLPVFVLFSLASFPIVAGRMSEMLSAYQFLVVGSFIALFRLRIIGRIFLLVIAGLQFYIQNYRTVNVDFFYFIGYPKQEMLDLINYKISIDPVLADIFNNL